jgi:hypothetical protein
LATAILVGWAAAMWAMGAATRWTSFAVGALPLLYFLAAGLYVQRRRLRSGGQRRFQFGMPFLFVTMTVAAVWLALARWDYVLTLDRHSRRQQVEAEIRKIVGTGEVHVSEQLVVQVKRATFNDDDLRRVLELQDTLREIDVDFQLLDLSNTAITDAGVRQLAGCDRLEYLFLSGTAVTDAGLEIVSELPYLKMISVDGAQVSANALARMRAERPKLNITAMRGGK